MAALLRARLAAPDLIAALAIWSVVTPQAVAYAQIAGLPPEAGLMTAPMAMLAYALIGTSHQLVVSATSAVSAATVGPMADGDPIRFALGRVGSGRRGRPDPRRSAALRRHRRPRVQAGDDRFLFGLGLVITLAQLPSLLGVKAGEGNFLPQLSDLFGERDGVHGATLAVGAGSLAV